MGRLSRRIGESVLNHAVIIIIIIIRVIRKVNSEKILGKNRTDFGPEIGKIGQTLVRFTDFR
jgi:hypothetical protein